MSNKLFRLMAKRGFLKPNGALAAISSAIAVVRLLRKLSGTAPKTLYTHTLKDGEVLVIADSQPQK